MSTRLMGAVDEDHGGLGVGDKRVGESHSHGSRTHHEVVRLDGSHRYSLTSAPANRRGETITPDPVGGAQGPKLESDD